jgi:hypothetical protein
MRGLSVRLIFYSELSVENCALWRVGPLCRVGPLNVLAPTGILRLSFGAVRYGLLRLESM